MVQQEEKFNFFVPIDDNELIKASKQTGESRYKNMVVQGVASDATEDTDGETLLPNGYELNRFKKYGFINYDHRSKDNPKYYIGEPVDAKVLKGNKFFIKGKLYDKSQMARDVWDTMILLKESGSDRQMGWSIEGKALERDRINPKIIKRALITGVALTLNPKNTNSYANIVKGEYNDAYIDYEYEMPELEKSENTAKVIYLVDITNYETGVRYTIDKNLNLKVEKAISTTSAKPLMKESLAGGKIKKLPLVSEELESIAKAAKIGLIKSEFLQDIKYNIIDLLKAKNKSGGNNWKTINGAHVLIGSGGQVIAGAGGNLSKDLSSIEGIQKYINDNYKEIPDPLLSKNEGKAAGIYRTDEGYLEMNSFLRKGKKVDNFIKEQVKTLTTAINKLKLKGDISLYRGVSLNDDLKKLLSSLKVGDSFIDKGFSSTSMSDSIVKDFAGSNGAIFEIKAKKGQKALPMENISTGNAKEDKKYRGEVEMLLAPNSKFKLISKSGNKYVFELV